MSSSSDPPAAVVARLMLPDDANVAGNVHGGTILQLMEQAGMIAAARHFNADTEAPHHGNQFPGLVRFEEMTFYQPMFVGEVASLTSQLIFTSEHSVLVKVKVLAENLAGKSRVTNSGLLWYCSFVPKGKTQADIVEVPQISPPPTDDVKATMEYDKAKELYEARKKREEESKATPAAATDGSPQGDAYSEFRKTVSSDPAVATPSQSIQTLCQVVLPGDCGTASHVAFAGFVMKLMDTAAGCCAYRHARTNVVTVTLSAIDFKEMVRLGDICTIKAELSFCAEKNMEITVKAMAASIRTLGKDILVAEGRFSFVALNSKNKVIPVPPLRYETDEEYKRAFESKVRYDAAKKERMLKKSKAAASG